MPRFGRLRFPSPGRTSHSIFSLPLVSQPSHFVCKSRAKQLPLNSSRLQSARATRSRAGAHTQLWIPHANSVTLPNTTGQRQRLGNPELYIHGRRETRRLKHLRFSSQPFPRGIMLTASSFQRSDTRKTTFRASSSLPITELTKILNDNLFSNI